jgi:hypothetical protein
MPSQEIMNINIELVFNIFKPVNSLHYKGSTLTHFDGTVTASETETGFILTWPTDRRLHSLNVVTSDFKHNS